MPALAAVVALGTGCTGDPGPDHDPSPPAVSPSGRPSSGGCPASGFAIRAEPPEAAMGLRAMTIVLVNCGTRAYSVNGYPAIRVLDADRQPLAVTVHHGPSITTFDDPGPSPITLAPGDSVSAALFWRNSVTRADVPAAEGRFVEISPAAGEPPQTVPELIDLGTSGRLDVTAWRRPS